MSTAPSAEPQRDGISVVFAGGGTAGHVGPMLAMGRAIRDAKPESEILMIGTADGLETSLVPAAGFAFETIDKVPFPRSVSLDAFAMPFKLRRAIKEARALLREHRADVVVGVGGYASTPVYLAAQKEGIPVVVHEGNIRPGLANKLGARKAAVVAAAFKDTPLPNAEWVGMPLRPEIAELELGPDAKQSAREFLGIDPQKPTVVVTGGSSGALNLNNTIAATITDITSSGAQIVHLTGHGKAVLDDEGEPLNLPGYFQFEYINGLEVVYQAADLVIARSGAGTVCELAAVGIGSVLVPLPIGNGEQRLNGQPLVEVGAAVMVDDENFTPAWVRGRLPELLADPPRLQYMATAATKLGRRDAAHRMAELIIDAATAKDRA